MSETMLSPEQEPSLEITHRGETSRIPSPEPEPSFLPLHDSSFRNLFLGFFCVFVAVMLFAGAWALLGEISLLALATAILVLFLMASLWSFGAHRQRGGLFLSFGLVIIVGALIPLLAGVVLKLAGQEVILRKSLAEGPQVSIGTLSGVKVSSLSSQPPLLTDAFGIFPNGQGEQIRVLVDCTAMVDGKMFLIRAGQMLPLHGRNNSGLEIRAADFLVTLPNDRAEVVSPMMVATSSTSVAPAQPVQAAAPSAPSGSDTKEQIRKSQEEAVRRFPALAIKDSDENRIFVDAYNDLKENNPKFLDNPNWPLTLAEQMGTAYAWVDMTKPNKARGLPNMDPSSIDMELDTQPPAPVQSDTLYLDESINAAEGRATPPRAEALPPLPQNLPGSEADGEMPDAPPLEIKP